METTTKHGERLGKNMAKIKSASVLTGVLYALVFIIIMPFAMNKGVTFDDVLLVAGILVLSALVVHFLLNGLYYMIISLPLLLSAVLFASGWVIWINAPIIIGSMDMLLSLIPFMDIEIGCMMEYMTRVGQSMMGLAGVFWWLVKKGKDINQAALYVYLLILSILGVASGLISSSLNVLFIIFWLTISYKIHEHPTLDTNEELGVLFKIIATLSLLVGTSNNFLSSFNSWHGEFSFGVITYSILVFVLVSFGIWNPKKLIKFIPSSVKPVTNKIFDLVKSSIFIKGV